MLTVFIAIFFLTQFKAGRRFVRALIEHNTGTVNIRLLNRMMNQRGSEFP